MKVSHDLPLHKVSVHIMCNKRCLGRKADHKNWMWTDIGMHTRYRFTSKKQRDGKLGEAKGGADKRETK